jgi:L-amino acid N-acyltransferase YncA
VKIVRCTYHQHASGILEIFNEAILNSTALFDYKPRAPDSMIQWFKSKEHGDFPVVGIEGTDQQLFGFASYGPFRAWPAYKYTVEHAVYVHKDHRGKGLGLKLMHALISAAQEQNYHLMVGGIEAGNVKSITLHEALGFTHAGTINQAGFKFGRWLDLSFYQLILQTPEYPVEQEGPTNNAP